MPLPSLPSTSQPYTQPVQQIQPLLMPSMSSTAASMSTAVNQHALPASFDEMDPAKVRTLSPAIRLSGLELYRTIGRSHNRSACAHACSAMLSAIGRPTRVRRHALAARVSSRWLPGWSRLPVAALESWRANSRSCASLCSHACKHTSERAAMRCSSRPMCKRKVRPDGIPPAVLPCARGTSVSHGLR